MKEILMSNIESKNDNGGIFYIKNVQNIQIDMATVTNKCESI